MKKIASIFLFIFYLFPFSCNDPHVEKVPERDLGPQIIELPPVIQDLDADLDYDYAKDASVEEDCDC